MKIKNFIMLAIIGMFSVIFVACAGTDDSANTETDENEETNETVDNEVDRQDEEGDEQSIAIHADTVNSHLVEDAVCVVNSRFEQGWRMVFRATVTDLNTDESIEEADVKVVLETGEEFDMEYGAHGDEGTMLYAIAWTIPDDFPTGTLDYEIVATVDGEEHTFEPFNVEPSKMTIVEGTGEATEANG